ncbi:hypothetical protein EC99P2_00020 [Enterococcus phage EC99P2]|nr:hypothetical protein EC99P2_00020 [Enterococcus phage EC99P2]
MPSREFYDAPLGEGCVKTVRTSQTRDWSIDEDVWLDIEYVLQFESTTLLVYYNGSRFMIPKHSIQEIWIAPDVMLIVEATYKEAIEAMEASKRKG